MSSRSSRFLVDATDCPVKAEIYRLAARHDWGVVLVSAESMGAPFEPWITKVVAGKGAIAETIANEAAASDVVITDDAALAAKVISKDAAAFTTRGQRWTTEGPQPRLPDNSRANNKARFESVIDDELRARMAPKP